jgi:hypothetical protein
MFITSIACITIGTIAQLHGMVTLVTKMTIKTSFLKHLLIKVYRFGIFLCALKVNNNVNVLDRFFLIQILLGGEAHDVNFVVNDNIFAHYYFLMEGIFQICSCFVQIIHEL